MSIHRFIFVYNARSGFLRAAIDSEHKMLSPGSYGCRLCGVTHSVVGMKRDWREFVDRLDFPVDFLHRDDLASRYLITDVELPAAFDVHHGQQVNPELWISADEMNRLESLDDLIALVESRLEGASPSA